MNESSYPSCAGRNAAGAPPDVGVRLREVEAELAETRARLIELERQWQGWLSIISHDLRGPLTVILGHSDNLLQAAGAASDEQKRAVCAIANAARRLDKMIGQVVDGARLDLGCLTFHPEEVDLAAIVLAEVRRARQRYPEASIHTDLSPDLPAILADRRRVGQIVGTLLSNAALFSPARATIRARLRRRGDDLVLTVTDQGAGVAPEEQAYLFERFFRPERLREVGREGLGLSLWIARRLAEAMGVRVEGQCAVGGQGATFALSLPLHRTAEGTSEGGPRI
jgi:signal transduction histidine kinase